MIPNRELERFATEIPTCGTLVPSDVVTVSFPKFPEADVPPPYSIKKSEFINFQVDESEGL
jgi:hypothetical protein